MSLSLLRLVVFGISLGVSAPRPPRFQSSIQQVLLREQNHGLDRKIRVAFLPESVALNVENEVPSPCADFFRANRKIA